jgi:hypothetical protein
MTGKQRHPGLDGRARDKDGEIRHKNGNTRRKREITEATKKPYIQDRLS